MNQKEQLEQELKSFAMGQYRQQKEFAERLLSSLRELQDHSEIIDKLVEVADSFTNQQIANIDPNYNEGQIFAQASGTFDRTVEEEERRFDHQLRIEIQKFESLVYSLSVLSLKRSTLEWGREQAQPHLETLNNNKMVRKEMEQEIRLANESESRFIKNQEQVKEIAAAQEMLKKLDDIDESSKIALESVATTMRDRMYEVKNDKEGTPLHWSAQIDSLEMARLHGTDNEAQDSQGNTPGMYEIKSSNVARLQIDHDTNERTYHRKQSHPIPSLNRPINPGTRNLRDHLISSTSLADAVLEVLSDGKKRTLSDIAKELWDLPDGENSKDFKKTKKTLTATVSREVQRGNIFRPHRGIYSTSMFNSTLESIQVAIEHGSIQIHHSNLEPNDMPMVREELSRRVNNEKNHAIQNRAFRAAPLSRDVVQLLGRVCEIDSLSIPRLAVEMKIINKKGSMFIFSDDKIGVLDESKINISSEGLEIDPTREGLRFVPTSPIIAFLDEHIALQDEIRSLISLYALTSMEKMGLIGEGIR